MSRTNSSELTSWLGYEAVSSEAYLAMKETAYLNYASSTHLHQDLVEIALFTLLPVLGVVLYTKTRGVRGLNDLMTFALPVGLAFAAPKWALMPAAAILGMSFFLVGTRHGSRREEEAGNTSSIRLARGSLSFLTTVCILAVDFPAIFPRGMGKTQTYGLSLMDVGVGAVVLVGAINRKHMTASGNMRVFFIRTLPTLVLGFGRFLFVSETDYYVPVSEYGVHWNFFVTLWVVAVVGEAIKRLILRLVQNQTVREGFLLVAAALFASAPIYLVYEHVGEWSFFFSGRSHAVDGSTGDLVELFWANREGVISSFGFVALDLLGSSVSRRLKTSASCRPVLLCLFTSLATFSFLTFTGSHPSRRMGNACFCAAVAAVVFWNLLAFKLLEQLTGHSLCQPPFFGSILKQPLGYFLLSNAMTGLVNMFFQTLLFPPTPALLVMTLYIVCLWTIGKLLP